MKRRVTAAVCGTVAALGLASCAGDDGGAAGGNDLVWSMWIGGTEDQEAWQAVADAVTDEHPDIDVSLQGAPFNDYWTRIATQLGSGQAPCIVSMQSLRINQFTDGLLPLTDLIENSDLDLDDFDEVALAGLEVDGTQYALPYDTGPMILFYNRDVFSEAGVADPSPGWSIDDFEDAGQALAEHDVQLFAAEVADLDLQATVLAYNGTAIIDEDGTITPDNADFADGVDWVASLVDRGWALGASSGDPDAADNAFLSGRVATVVNGPWSLLDLDSKSDFDLGVATLPAGVGAGQTYAAGSGFGISEACEDPEAAFDAIQVMTSDDVLTSLGEQGRAYPGRTAAQPAWLENTGIDGVEQVLEHAQDSALPLPGSPHASQFGELLNQHGPQAVNGDRPADEVLAEIARQLGQ